MTTQPRTALDEFGIQRKSDGQPPIINKLTLWDVVASGEIFTEYDRQAVPILEQGACLIGQLWGVDYYADAGTKSRKDMKGAAKWVLVDGGGDIDAMFAAYEAMRQDRRLMAWIRKVESPYAVARMMYNRMAKMKAEVRRIEEGMKAWAVEAKRDMICPTCKMVWEVRGPGPHTCDDCGGVELKEVDG